MGKVKEVDVKSIGTLIDELSVLNIKIFYALEEANICQDIGDAEGVGKEYGKAQKLNSRRSRLIQAIDKRLGEEDLTLTDKTF